MDAADSDFYEERLEAAQGGLSALGDSAVRRAVLAGSTSQPSSPAHSSPASPRDAAAAGAQVGVAVSICSGDGEERGEVSFDGGLSLPAVLYDRLFSYQQVGVQWMWELHMQRSGGVVPFCCAAIALLLLEMVDNRVCPCICWELNRESAA